MKPLKPWLSYAQQLLHLQRRGMLVDDTAAALNYLERVGYFRLSGYWYPLRAIDEVASRCQRKAVRLNSFAADSQFSDVVRLYVFDKKLRLLALDALERIETAVRVDVSYLLGQRDPLAHEISDCLHGKFTKKPITFGPDAGKTPHQVWMAKYRSQIQRARKEPFVLHHLERYGALPIWAAIELWDFGLLSKLFAGMKHADQQVIATIYRAASGEVFAQWLRSLNFIRNVSAHHSRLWNINVLELSQVPGDWPTGINHTRTFFYFCLMQHLLRIICPESSWGRRFKNSLADDFPNRSRLLSLNDFGLCDGWENLAVWAPN